jgi:hypothetical protein
MLPMLSDLPAYARNLAVDIRRRAEIVATRSDAARENSSIAVGRPSAGDARPQ